MSTRPPARASSTLRLGVSAALLLASLTPTTARAEPPAIPKEAEEHYDRGVREREAGRHAVAAQEFTAAYEGMPTGLKELRASILFDLVDAHRSAFAAGGRTRGREHPAAHLCAAEAALEKFRGAAGQGRKPRSKKSTDELKAEELHAAVQADLEKARADSPDLDCATAELPRGAPDEAPPPDPGPVDAKPAPRPKPNMPLVIAGSVTAAVGLAMFGLMAGGLVRGNRADADGNALVDMNATRDELDPDIQEIDRRGRVGNNMAIAGGVLGGVCLGTGVALLVLGLRGKPGGRVAAAPYATPQTAGFTVRLQF
jgi:hypothetical protein